MAESFAVFLLAVMISHPGIAAGDPPDLPLAAASLMASFGGVSLAGSARPHSANASQTQNSIAITDGVADRPASVQYVDQITATVVIKLAAHTFYVPQAYIDASEGFQSKFGHLRIRALLPCLVPVPARYTAEKGSAGWGSDVVARLGILSAQELTGAELLSSRVKNNESVKNTIPSQNILENKDTLFINSQFHVYRDFLYHRDIFWLPNSVPLFLLDCSRGDRAPFPSCTSRNIISNDLVVEYTYSRKFVDPKIEESQVIEKSIEALFDYFQRPNMANELVKKGVCT